MATPAQDVFRVLSGEGFPLDVDTIVESTGLSQGRAQSALDKLIGAVLVETSDGAYELTPEAGARGEGAAAHL